MLKTINRFWSAITFACVIVMTGEFIVVSYRLKLCDFSKDLLIRKGECLSVVAVVAAAVAMLVAVVVALPSVGRRVVVVGCDCGLLRRQCLVTVAVAMPLLLPLLAWQWRQWVGGAACLVTAAMSCYGGSGHAVVVAVVSVEVATVGSWGGGGNISCCYCGGGSLLRFVVVAVEADCWGGGVHVGCCCCCVVGGLLGRRRRAGSVHVGCFCCGGGSPIQMFNTINWF
jgi:hypothetical protein